MEAISPYLLHIGVMTGIYILLAQALNIMLGYSGLLSLATPAFFGLGAYVSALLTLRFGWDSTLTFACAAMLSGAAGAALGVPSLRLSRHSFVIVTLSATLLLQLIASNWIDLTRGALGISGIPTAVVFGVALNSKLDWLVFMLLLSVLGIAFLASIVTSRLGRAMVAVRDNEPLAMAAGIDVLKIRLFAFACSGLLAGLAGACYAHYLTFIDPGLFGFSISESLLVMVVLGAAGSIWGPVAGAVFFTALPEVLRMAPEVKSLLYGSLLLLIVLFMPSGIGRWFRRRAADSAAAGR
jgi:branched-chain amino acid transport system permease protein